MRQIAGSDIIIDPDRMRKEFNEDALADLRVSILSKGLLHAPVLRQEADGLHLVAGERRVRAMRWLISNGYEFKFDGAWVEKGMIPYTLMGDDCSKYDLIEAELEENVVRENLTWQEQASGRAKLLKLRQAQAAERGESYTVKDLATELQRAGASDASVQKVARDITVARFLDKPEVREAKSFGDAMRAAKKSTESVLLEALGDLVDEESKVNPPTHTFIEGDSLTILPTLPANTYDCVLTDPPYGIGIDDSGSMVSHGHHYNDSEDYLREILDSVPLNLYRITRAQAHVYWFCDLRKFHLIAAALEDAGFAVSALPIIWWKRGKAMAPDVTRWPKREYECILYAIKGDKPPLKVAGDVIATSYSAELQQAEKPKELFVELLSRSVMAGSKVIDPFAGSGVIFTAAEVLRCSATGIELDPARGDIARIRANGL